MPRTNETAVTHAMASHIPDPHATHRPPTKTSRLRSRATSSNELPPPPHEERIGHVGTRVADTKKVASPGGGGPVLVAAGLSAEQERLFGSEEGKVSAFWRDVEQQLCLTPKGNADEGSRFSIVTTADAAMSMKAAHTARGLYLCFEVTDNCFMECDPERYYDVDAIDLLLDSRPSAEITDPANDTRLICRGWGLSLSTRQFQVAFGNRRPPPFFLRNYADPWDFTQHRSSFEEAHRRLGIDIRFVKLSSLVRVQEWFLPWAEVGTGELSEEPPRGSKLAFAVGYNDTDADGATKKLRLMGPSEPWKHGAGSERPRGWGDLEIG